MTELPRDPDDASTPVADAAGLETGSAPQPLDFPGADQEPPGRPDGDSEPGDQQPGEPAD